MSVSEATTLVNITSFTDTKWKVDPQYVYIGNHYASEWSNKYYPLESYPQYGIEKATQRDCINLYEQNIVVKMLEDNMLYRLSVEALYGKKLVCHCAEWVSVGRGGKRTPYPALPCHGEVLVKWATLLHEQRELQRRKIAALDVHSRHLVDRVQREAEHQTNVALLCAKARVEPMGSLHEMLAALDPIFEADKSVYPERYKIGSVR